MEGVVLVLLEFFFKALSSANVPRWLCNFQTYAMGIIEFWVNVIENSIKIKIDSFMEIGSHTNVKTS